MVADGGIVQGDMSGVMGTSYFDDDGPKMCFNAYV
jgi:hypothetical protein